MQMGFTGSQVAGSMGVREKSTQRGKRHVVPIVGERFAKFGLYCRKLGLVEELRFVSWVLVIDRGSQEQRVKSGFVGRNHKDEEAVRGGMVGDDGSLKV